MRCPTCGAENLNGAKFCSGCGKEFSQDLQQNNQYTQPQSNYNQTQSGYAQQSNNYNQSQNSYAQSQNNYNQPLNNNYNGSNYNYNNPNNSDKTKKIIIIVCAVVALLVVAGFAYKQIRLYIVDKEIQKDAENLGTLDDTETNNSSNNNATTVKYSVGDAVTLLDGSNWHVVGYNSQNQVILLLDTLVKENYGYGSDGSATSQQYANSNIKKYLEETYLPSLKSALANKGGSTSNIKVRLLTVDEYMSIIDQEFASDYMSSTVKFNSTVNTCEVVSWLGLTDSFWTMNNVREYDSSSTRYGAYAVKKYSSSSCSGYSLMIWSDYSAKDGAVNYTGSFFGVRPVIETDSSNIK